MPALLPIVSAAALLCGAIAIGAHYVQPRRPWLIAVFKPLATILILGVALLPGRLGSEAYARAIAAGLVFSLLGDILLMLPDRFIQGLAAFLLAHCAYIVAFHEGAAAPGFAWALAAAALVGGGVLSYLWNGLTGGMKPPVTLYVIVIGLMTALAVGRWLGRPAAPTLRAAAGALLFLCSDAMLAIDRFRRPFRPARAAVLGSYYAAQLLIALSV